VSVASQVGVDSGVDTPWVTKAVRYQSGRRSYETYLCATGRTIIFACLKPLVDAAFVESMFTLKQTKFGLGHIVIETDEALALY
jgi:hypothetical protein